MAMSHAIKKNYDLSKEYFLKVIDILNENDTFNPAIFLLVLKKYSILLRLKEDYEDLGSVLEQMFFINFANSGPSTYSFLQTISNLFIHYSKFDVKKV